MKSVTLLTTLLLLDCISTSFSIKCLECKDVPRPDVCGHSVKCHGHSNCFVREYITTSGDPLFSTGCISAQLCGSIKRQINMTLEAEDPGNDVDVCLECCNGNDYCNNKGCGIKTAGVSERGPYCFECDIQNKMYGCRTIKQCDLGYVCSLQKAAFAGMYKTACIRKAECATVANQQQDVTGMRMLKRSGANNLTIPLPYCCENDYCNDIHNFVANDTMSVDGGWSVWSDWSACSFTCGPGGQESRTRACENPTPRNDGAPCQGTKVENRDCLVQSCPVDGGWSDWGNWSSCSVSCGPGGNMSRSRTCSNPPPQNNGAYCQGNRTESKECPVVTCRVDGQWSAWEKWSHCTKTCGPDGYRHRSHLCDNPVPSDGGSDCPGENHQRDPCNTDHDCPDVQCKQAGFQYIDNHGTPLCLNYESHKSNWQDARKRCASTSGSHLFVVTNDDEQKALMDLINSHSHGTYVWIGLYAPEHGHTWRWVDSTQYSYNKFGGHAHGPKHNECGCPYTDNTWYTCGCNDHLPYVCQIPV